MSDTAPSAPKIMVYGHGDKSSSGFSCPSAFIDYIRAGIDVAEHGRYRYTQNKNVDIIVLSRDGQAYGHFEITGKEKSNARDRANYPPVTCVYIVGKRALYTNPVGLTSLGVQVTSFGTAIPMSKFDEIKSQPGEIQEFHPGH